MPLVLELIVLMLAAYAVGLALGWVVWGTDLAAQDDAATEPDDDGENP